jgi:UDP-4-amino-4,6-dideoxy-N-acetyl-beta-L-altrosamine N-acetyltransferase
MSSKQLRDSMTHKGLFKKRDIYLRRLTKKDLSLIIKWRNTPEIKKWFFSNERFTIEKQIKWYEEYRKKKDARCFIICKKSKPIGTVSLYDIDHKEKKAQFGRLLIGQKQDRGKGYAKQATKIMIKYAFCELRLKEVFLEIFRDNIKAISIYRKCGFKQEGNSRKKVFKHGRFKDVILMSIKNSIDS